LLTSFVNAIQETVYAERYSTRTGLLQQIDPRVKLFSIAALVLSAVAVRTISPLIILFGAIMIFCVASRIPLTFFTLRTTVFIPIFAGLIALPLLFMTPGVALASLSLDGVALVITSQGLYRAAQFTLRVWVCVALSVLLILTTRFSNLIGALDRLRFPRVFVMMTSITYRFIFLFLNEGYRMLLARESRTTKGLRWRENVGSLARIVATLFVRAHERGERVYLAMTARGYAGRLRRLDEMKCTKRDWAFANICALVCVAMLSIEFLRFGGL
jgi:cobalt/nickel transport system permease protein